MGKSKRNRKKQSKSAVLALATPAVEPARTAQRRKPLILLSVLAVLIVWYLLMHDNSTQPAPQSSQSQSSQAGLPQVQTGDSQSLSPSGSVDLQSGPSPASSGSVQ